MNKLVVILTGILLLTGCAALDKVVTDLKDIITPVEVPLEVK